MNNLSYALLADVLASLENASGIPLGTAAYLQVQELMRQLPADTKTEDLKTLLAPLLCRTAEEQEQFYDIFEKSWARVRETGELAPEQLEAVEEAAQVAQRRQKTGWKEILAYVLLLVAVLAVFVWWRNSNPERIRPTREQFNVEVGSSGKYALALRSPSEVYNNVCEQTDSTLACIRRDSVGRIRASEKDPGVYYADIHYTALRAGIDSFCLQVKPDVGSFRRRYTVIFNVLDSLPVAPPMVEDTTKMPDTMLYQERPIPHPRDLSQLEPPKATAWQEFLIDYEWLLKIACLLLSGLLLWWLARRIEAKQRRLIAEHQPNVKPPYTWNISLGAEPDITFGEDFYTLLLQLRRRESDEWWRLDVPRSVRATVEKGGMPDFRYVQVTRPAEYLLLIDRQSGRDHQARLFDLLYRAFRSQEVLVERYWYDEGDPRRCYNETHPNGVSLRDLHYYHPQSRVLLLGNAYALLHPGKGNLNKWAVQTFSSWTDRAVLSTQPLSVFGRRERTLQELFQVVPASLSGLREVIDLFDADENKTPDLHPRRFPDAAQHPVQLLDNDLLKTIQAASNANRNTDQETSLPPHPSFLIWTAACAMYPELHWDLTLQLAHLIDGLGQIPPARTNAGTSSAGMAETYSLTTLASLQALSRLPWFSEGEMPLEVRKILLAWLESEHPETHYRLREGLHRLLAQNPPPDGSAAYDDYAMNLALNEWLYTRDPARKKELQRDIAARLAAGQQADFMVLRLLDPGSSLTPEQFEVPEDWKKYLKEKGYAFLKPRRAWWWAAPVWLLCCGLALWWQPQRVGCKYEAATHENREYCIETQGERLIFWEMQMMDTLKSGGIEAADSLFRMVLLGGFEDGNRTLSYNEVNDVRPVPRNETSPKGPAMPAMTSFSLSEVRSQYKLIYLMNSGGQPRSLSFTSFGPVDSIAFFQNAAVAYFNEGVKIHKAYSAMWEVVERSGQKPAGADYRPRSEACAYFSRAREINDLLPDTAQLWYVRDAAKCELPAVRDNNNALQPPVKDITISGQLNNAETKRPLYLNEWQATRIEAQGLRPATLSRGAFFAIWVPGNRQTPVELKVSSPGFEDFNSSIRPADFGKYQNIALQPSRKCYEVLRAEGLVLMEQKQYLEAAQKFTAALNCPDKPRSELKIVEMEQNLAIVEQSLKAQETLLKFRLDDERQANADDDGDGVPNKDDQCPKEKGTLENKGCPPPKPDENLSAVLAEIEKNMVNVAGGTFDMGCDEKRDGDCSPDEQPVHPVRLSSFEMSKFEVTQAQWQTVMGDNPSAFQGCDNCPVEWVSWDDIQVFLNKLNTLTGKSYRLPTEAEWEYAARGGSKSRRYKYSGSNKLDEIGWYANNSGSKTHPVGSKKPNELGLYDMSGNVSELCSDWYGEYYMVKIPVNNPKGPEKGNSIVTRGGTWSYREQGCVIVKRLSFSPGMGDMLIGFRLASSPQ